MSCDHELANEWARCSEKNNSYIWHEEFDYRKVICECVENQEVERIRTYKLLGVTTSGDLKWNAHTEYLISKADKRLYALM